MFPRAILFDLDDTILAYGPRPLLVLELAEQVGAARGSLSAQELADAVEARFVAFWADETRGQLWRQRIGEARRMIVRDAFAELRRAAPGLTVEEADRFARDFHIYREERMQPFPKAMTVIETLKREGVRLALVTNGAGAGQRAKIERFDLARHFDHIQIEGEAGFGKPDDRSYLHAMETLGVSASETWMVGDNLEWEVAGPQRHGIFAIWHDHRGEGLPAGSLIVPDRIIRNLGELLE